MQTTAQSWLVLKLTGSPLALGVASTLQFLPMLFLTLFGGVLADRLPKQRTLLITQSIALLQAVLYGLLIATGSIQLWHIYIMAAIAGLIAAVDDPVREAFVVEMVGRSEIANAVALNAISFNGARMVGPAIAGLILATVGVPAVMLLNAVSFLAVIVALLKIDRQALFARPPAATGSVFANLREGFEYIRSTPQVMWVMIPIAFVATFGFNFIIMLPLLSRYVIRLDDAGFGLLQTFVGLGSILAGAGVIWLQTPSLRRLLGAGLIYGLLLAITGFVTNLAVAGILLILLGGLSVVFSTTSSTLLQNAAPNALRGRVMSFSVFFYMGTKPISAFLVGALSDRAGTSIAILTVGILCVVGAIAGFFYYQRTNLTEPALVSEAGD